MKVKRHVFKKADFKARSIRSDNSDKKRNAGASPFLI